MECKLYNINLSWRAIMLLTKEVEVKWGNNRKIYEPLGYNYTKRGDKFIVRIEDLAQDSGYLVDMMCDYCGESKQIAYTTYNRQRNNSSVKKDCCKNCKHLKLQETAFNDHGHKHSRQRNINVNDIKSEFVERNYIPLFEEYINRNEYLQYKCIKHIDKGVLQITYGNFHDGKRGCKYCGAENRNKNRRKYNIDTIGEEFKSRKYTLMSKEFTSLDAHLTYTCDIHPEDDIQFVTYANFKNAKHNCKSCCLNYSKGSTAGNWKGGLTPLYNCLRTHIYQWIEDSKKESKCKCILTGKKSSLVHHLYGFNTILAETLEVLNFKWDKTVGIKLEDLSDVLLEQIKVKFLELHYHYGLGVCVSRKYHNLFHSLYGSGNNTPEQFREFVIRYELGEFELQVSQSTTQSA